MRAGGENKPKSKEIKHEACVLLKARWGVYTEEVMYHNVHAGIAFNDGWCGKGNDQTH